MDLRQPYSRTRTYASACHITAVKGANESDGDKWANSYPGIEITIFGDNARYSASESGGFVRGIHGFNKHQSLQNEHRAHAHQAYRKKSKGSSKCMKIVSLNWLSWTWKVFSPLLPRNGGNNVAIG